MRVLIINDTYNREGGVKTAIDNQLKILKRNKIDVKLFCFGGSGIEDLSESEISKSKISKRDINEREIDEGEISKSETKEKGRYLERCIIKENPFKLVRYFFGIFFYPAAYIRLVRYIKKTKPDLIHLHNIDRYPITILLACKRAGCRVIRTVHDYGIICPTMWCVKKNNLRVCEGGLGIKCLKSCISLPEYLIHSLLFLKNRLQKKVVDVFLSPSEMLRGYLERHGFKNAVCCPLGIDTLEIKKTLKILEAKESRDKTDKKNREGRKGGKEDKRGRLLLYVGELSAQKGIHLLIKAIPLISEKIPDIKLRIVGEGGEKEALMKLANKIGQEKRIFFAGRLKPSLLYREYSKSSFLVVPSLWLEQFGLVGIESICCGTPVIASRRGGITEWLEEGKNGHFFKSLDYRSIAEDIISFLKAGVGQKGFEKSRKKILSKFSLKEYEKNILRVYSHTS